MLMLGLIAPFANGPIQAILQATVAADYQGRVLSLMGSLAGATAPLGLILAAPIAEMVGGRSWYLTGGSVCLAMRIAGYFLPSLMRIEEPPGESEPLAHGAATAHVHAAAAAHASGPGSLPRRSHILGVHVDGDGPS